MTPPPQSPPKSPSRGIGSSARWLLPTILLAAAVLAVAATTELPGTRRPFDVLSESHKQYCKPCPHALPARVRFVLWDTEHTAWEGSNARRWMGFIPGTRQRERREVIQVSALRVVWDAERSELHPNGSLRIFVRPTLNPTLSAYVMKLTGITQAEVRGLPCTPPWPFHSLRDDASSAVEKNPERAIGSFGPGAGGAGVVLPTYFR